MDVASGRELWRRDIAFGGISGVSSSVEHDGQLWIPNSNSLVAVSTADGEIRRRLYKSESIGWTPISTEAGMYAVLTIGDDDPLISGTYRQKLVQISGDQLLEITNLDKSITGAVSVSPDRVLFFGTDSVFLIEITSGRVLFKGAGVFKALFGAIAFCIEVKPSSYLIWRYDLTTMEGRVVSEFQSLLN